MALLSHDKCSQSIATTMWKIPSQNVMEIVKGNFRVKIYEEKWSCKAGWRRRSSWQKSEFMSRIEIKKILWFYRKWQWKFILKWENCFEIFMKDSFVCGRWAGRVVDKWNWRWELKWRKTFGFLINWLTFNATHLLDKKVLDQYFFLVNLRFFLENSFVFF